MYVFLCFCRENHNLGKRHGMGYVNVMHVSYSFIRLSKIHIYKFSMLYRTMNRPICNIFLAQLFNIITLDLICQEAVLQWMELLFYANTFTTKYACMLMNHAWCWWQVRERCKREWTMFQSRLANAEDAYYKAVGVDMFNSTTPQWGQRRKFDLYTAITIVRFCMMYYFILFCYLSL